MRNVDNNASCDLHSIEKSYDDNLIANSDEIEKNKKFNSEKLNEIASKKKILDNLSAILIEGDAFPDTVINEWVRDESYWNFDTNDITGKVELNDKSQLREIPKRIEKIKDEMKVCKGCSNK